MDLFKESNGLGAIIERSNYFKEEKPVFSVDSEFDGKHINNLAPNKQIPDSLVATINEGITLEQLDEVAHLPICHYKTQITIHGVCNNLKSNRLNNGYVGLVINNNKSLGVRWLAIDEHKKDRIADYVGCYGWRTYEDSQVYCYLKNFEYEPETKEQVYNQVVGMVKGWRKSLFFGYVDVLDYEYKNSGWFISNAKSHFTIVIYLQGIYEKNIEAFLQDVCADSWDNIEQKHNEFKQKMEQRRQERAQEQADQKKREEAATEAFHKWCADNPFPDKFQKIDFADLKPGDIIGYYGRTFTTLTENNKDGEFGKKEYYQLYLNYKRLCYRRCDENGNYEYKGGHVLERRDLPNEFFVWRQSADTSNTAQSTRPTRGTDIEILDYRTDEVVVLGYSKPYYHEIKDLGGGKWNKFISIEGRPMAQGWVFPRSKKAALEKIFGIESQPTAEPEPQPQPEPAAEPEPANEPETQPKPQDEPKFKNKESLYYNGHHFDDANPFYKKENGDYPVKVLFYRNGKYMVFWQFAGARANFYANESELSREPRNTPEPPTPTNDDTERKRKLLLLAKAKIKIAQAQQAAKNAKAEKSMTVDDLKKGDKLVNKAGKPMWYTPTDNAESVGIVYSDGAKVMYRRGYINSLLKTGELKYVPPKFKEGDTVILGEGFDSDSHSAAYIQKYLGFDYYDVWVGGKALHLKEDWLMADDSGVSGNNIMSALNGAETEHEKKIARFIMEIGTADLTDEENNFYNAFIEPDSIQYVKITDLLGLFNILKIVTNNPEFGSRHIMIKHFGVRQDYVTADEIVKMGEIIRSVEPKPDKDTKKHPNRRIYEKIKNGIQFKVVIDLKNKKSGVLISFYSNRAQKK